MSKLKHCKSCGAEIASDTKVCPQCGAKNKKPFYVRWWFWVIIVALLIGSCGSSEEPTSETTPTSEISETLDATETTAPIEETTEPTTIATEATTEESEAVDSVSIETAIVLIESTLEGSFTNYNISYEDDIITIDVWEDGIAIGATLAAAGDDECLEAWTGLVENQKELSSTLFDFVQTLGLADTSVVVNVLNDGNTENILLSTINGVVLYDCVNE